MILMIHFLASSIMTGVIWVMQLVHYPAFKYIAPDKAKKFHEFHTDAISLFVAPLMIIELGTSILLARGLSSYGLSILVLTVLLWGSTFTLQVPLHRRLGKQWTETIINQLIWTNWFRTGVWTLKTLVISYWLYYS